MKIARKKLNDYFVKPYVMVERVKNHLQSNSKNKVFYADVEATLGMVDGQLRVLKSRNSDSIAVFILRWCLQNDLNPKDFLV